MSDTNTETELTGIEGLQAGSESDIVDQLDKLGWTEEGGVPTDDDSNLSDEDEQDGTEEDQDDIDGESDEGDDQESEEAEADEAGEGDNDDDDFISYTNEAGEEVEISVSNLVDAQLKVDGLEKSNTDLKTQMEYMPEEVKGVISNIHGKLGQYEQQLSDLDAYLDGNSNNLPPIDPRWANPDSEHYDADKYYAAKQARETQGQQSANLKQELANIKNERYAYEKQFRENQLREHVRDIQSFWPEIVENNGNVYSEVANLLSEFNFSNEEIGAVTDPRQFRLLKELLDLRADTTNKSADTKKAMKIIAKNPKLIKRGAKAPRKNQKTDALAKLHKTGSEEDAMRALSNMKGLH